MTATYNVKCPIESVTPPGQNHFFGYHDICPWSPAGDQILLLRYARILDRHPSGSDAADVCLWNSSTGAIEKIDETLAWNYQLGAQAQWLDNERILFNDLDGGTDRARIINRTGGILRSFRKAIASVSTTRGIGPSFGRLGKYYPSYGYQGAGAPSIDHPCPQDDGLWVTDLVTGEVKLLFSLAMLAERAGIADERTQFVSHPLFDRQGGQFVFAHTVKGADNALYTNMMVANSDGSRLRSVANEKVSHLDWYDHDTLIVWARFSNAMSKLRQSDVLKLPGLSVLVRLARKWQGPIRNSLMAEGFHLVSVADPSQRKKVAPIAIPEDGHCTMHPSLKIMVSDTYPDADNKLHLYLYSFERDVRVDVQSFDHGVAVSDGGMRCDLHPRWNREGDKISVDICEAGIRRMAIVDVKPALTMLAA